VVLLRSSEGGRLGSCVPKGHRSLKTNLKEVDKLRLPFSGFSEALELYRAAKMERYQNLHDTPKLVELLNDLIDAIYAIYRALPIAKSISDLEDYIDELFSDNNNGHVTQMYVPSGQGIGGRSHFPVQAWGHAYVLAKHQALAGRAGRQLAVRSINP